MTEQDEIKKQVQDRVAQEEATAAAPKEEEKPRIDSKLINECLFANELGDSVLYATMFRDQFLYCNSSQEWYVWSGHVWKKDIMARSLAAVDRIAEVYLNEYRVLSQKIADMVAGKDNDEDDEGIGKLKKRQGNLLKRASQLRGDKRRTACLKWARSNDDPLAITGDEFDLKPMLFPCANGVIDLERGTLAPGNPRDYLSLASPVEFKGINEPAPIWDKALLEIFEKDEEMVAYLARLFGYGITGRVHEKAFPILYGKTGWNGRSLIVETIAHVMGQLASPIQSEMLLSSKFARSASGPSPDVMALKGIRIAFASEIDEGQRFSSGKIKWYTGKDQLIGRNPHDREQTRFSPTHKIFLMSNTLPQAPPNDKAFWERMHLIPFNVSFVNREPQELYERRAILDLDSQVLKEASGILAWLIRGCIAWQNEGLKPPEKILKAKETYRRDEDLLADYIEECCIQEPGAREKASTLYSNFVDWFHDNIGKKEWTGTRFGKQLGAKFEKSKSEGCNIYHGIRLPMMGERDSFKDKTGDS